MAALTVSFLTLTTKSFFFLDENDWMFDDNEKLLVLSYPILPNSFELIGYLNDRTFELKLDYSKSIVPLLTSSIMLRPLF